MILTEEEAKTKWCPQPSVGRCLASDCMMWRWYSSDYNYKTGLTEANGYCGLAGEPK